MPRVSVIMPAFNAEQYIAQALQSIARQSYDDWELIVVDDGSRDATEEIVKRFEKKSPGSFTYYKHETNRGLPAARNSGIRKARGNLIALLDADDYWDPYHLSSIVPLFVSQDIGLIYSGAVLFDNATGEIIGPRFSMKDYSGEFPYLLYDKGNVIQPSAVLINKSVFDVTGYFDESLKYCEDLDFWIRVARCHYNIIYSGKNTCYYRKHDKAMTAKSAALVEAMGLVYLKHINWPDLSWDYRHSVAAKTLSNAGRMYFGTAPEKSARLFLDAWKAYPQNVLYILYAIVSFAASLFRKRG